MTTEQQLRLMQLPEQWPLRAVLALVHRQKRDGYGLPLCALLAMGHGSRVFFANVGDFRPGELASRRALELAVKRFESVSYLTFRAVLADWRID